MKKFLDILCVIMVVTVCCSSSVLAAVTDVDNYCVVPPFVQQAVKPNLLLMIDNSASMFDLVYADEGCSTCATPRTPKYCYDETYSDANGNTYAGYFGTSSYYDYDITNGKFVEISSFPAAGACTYYVANKFCVALDGSTPPKVTKFSAVGNYLNWLTASKFDVQKSILTGGKWDGANLNAESRGCVGRGFIKQPLSTNSGNFVEGGTNTPFPISLSIKGAKTSYDDAAPSQGGQTSIYFYKGASALNYAKCDEAIHLLETTNSINASVRDAVAQCIGATGDTDLAGKKKQIFQQSLQECWQYFRNSPPSLQGNDYLTVKNFCTDVYNLRDTASVAAGTGHLSYNPASTIVVGNADLLCSDNYVGACYSGQLASLPSTFTNMLALLSPSNASAAAGTVQFKSATYSVNENGGSVTVWVSRTGGSDGKVNVTYATANGTATAGSDYVAKSGTLTWNNNNADDKSITFVINDDALVEGNETFTVTLSSTEIPLGAPSTTTVTIADNDTAGSPGTISFESATPGSVNESAGSIALNVNRLGGSTGAATVNYATSNGTALAGSDYSSASGTLSWADGDSSTKTITIPIISDAVAEPNEAFTVTLSGATGASLGSPATATVTITETAVSSGTWPNSWASDACVKTQHELYCSGLSLPPVIDPTNVVLDATSTFVNLPAVIADVVLEGQLGSSLKLISGGVDHNAATVKVSTTTPAGTLVTPTGLIQSFANKLRMGFMSFNYNGSATECAANTSIPCPKICSASGSGANAGNTCTTAVDCCPGGSGCTCDDTSSTTNKDGAKIYHYVGKGSCSISGAACAVDAHCTILGDTCVSESAGTHSSGLIAELDILPAANWTPFSEAFNNAIGYFARVSDGVSRTENIRINDTDYSNTMNPSQFVCQQNYVLLITDGVATADQNANVMSLAALYNSAAGGTSGACTSYKGSMNLDNLTWLARNRNISTFNTSGSASAAPATLDSRDRITTYVVFNGQDNGGTGECDSVTMMTNAATKGGGKFFQAETPADLRTGLTRAFEEMAVGVSSGTAASIVNNRGESGSNLLQAVFYPMKEFTGGTSLDWIGEMQNLWYYLDPFLSKNTIREDSVYGAVTKDYKLNLLQDYVIETQFNTLTNTTEAKRFGDNGAGVYTLIDTVSADAINAIWKAGDELHKRNVTYSGATRRKIYTNLGTGLNLFDSTAVSGNIQSWGHVQEWLQASSAANAKDIIDYTNGFDIAGYRSRHVNYNGVTYNAATSTSVGVWKLGDIVSSTPQVQAGSALQQYYSIYGDTTYNAFTSSTAYANRNMVYVGSNDGMLHAFKMGVVAKDTTPAGQKAHITDTTNLGKEEWAFVPQNSLPYLQYLMSPGYAGKSHVFLVDGSSTLVDVSIAKPAGCVDDYSLCTRSDTTWKTLLVGGMGTGGATRPSNGSCNYASDCVKGPVTAAGKESAGLSSYFAIDVTDPVNPVLKWEFNHPELGFATSGPSIVRVVGADGTKNGKWFAVFASGPTGPIDSNSRQLLGRSDQNLKLFVIDLGTTETTIAAYLHNLWIIDTGIKYAFSGSISNSTLDVDRSNKGSASYYSDDAVYLGYTQPKSVDATVTPNVPDWSESRGGVLRLLTKNSTNPATWVVTKLIENDPSQTLTQAGGIGPVTTAITKLQDKTNKKLWLFFGTGRYFYKDFTGIDQADQRQKLFGVMDPCYTSDNGLTCEKYCKGKSTVSCNVNADCGVGGECISPTVSVDKSKLNNQDSTPSVKLDTDETGWYVTLADTVGGDTGYKAERLITDPKASTNGVVYFTTFAPAANVCGFGGQTYLWAMNYSSGSQPAASALLGKALIQVSTGSFVPIDLRTAFTAQDNRRTAVGVTGVPPKAQGLTLITRPQPVKKILHIQER